MPFMENLYEATHENVQLAVLADCDALFVEKINGPQSVPILTRVGGRLPLHATGVGKALLAYGPPEPPRGGDRARPAAAHAHSPSPIRTSCAVPWQEVRRNGFAYTRDEMTLGSVSVAAPIFGPEDAAVAAISLVVRSATAGHRPSGPRRSDGRGRRLAPRGRGLGRYAAVHRGSVQRSWSALALDDAGRSGSAPLPSSGKHAGMPRNLVLACRNCGSPPGACMTEDRAWWASRARRCGSPWRRPHRRCGTRSDPGRTSLDGRPARPQTGRPARTLAPGSGRCRAVACSEGRRQRRAGGRCRRPAGGLLRRPQHHAGRHRPRRRPALQPRPRGRCPRPALAPQRRRRAAPGTPSRSASSRRSPASLPGSPRATSSSSTGSRRQTPTRTASRSAARPTPSTSWSRTASPTRTAPRQVASDLILTNKVDLIVTSSTPETTNPVAAGRRGAEGALPVDRGAMAGVVLPAPGGSGQSQALQVHDHVLLRRRDLRRLLHPDVEPRVAPPTRSSPPCSPMTTTATPSAPSGRMPYRRPATQWIDGGAYTDGTSRLHLDDLAVQDRQGGHLHQRAAAAGLQHLLEAGRAAGLQAQAGDAWPRCCSSRPTATRSATWSSTSPPTAGGDPSCPTSRRSTNETSQAARGRLHGRQRQAVAAVARLDLLALRDRADRADRRLRPAQPRRRGRAAGQGRSTPASADRWTSRPVRRRRPARRPSRASASSSRSASSGARAPSSRTRWWSSTTRSIPMCPIGGDLVPTNT